MDYSVTEDKLHDLNVIVGEKGGTIPSAVSEALRKAQISAASGAQVALQANLNEAIEANKLNGAAWTDVQNWHNDVKEDGGDVDPPPIDITPPPAGISTVPCRYKITAVEAPQHFQLEVNAGTTARATIAVADGKQVTVGYSETPDEFKEGQASSGNGTALAIVPAGLWYINYKLSPGMGGAANGDVSVYAN